MENTPHVGPYTGPSLITAAAVARDRLEKYIAGKLNAASVWDEDAWAFYTFLLEQAKSYRITSGYTPPALFNQDEATAFANYVEIRKNSKDSSPQSVLYGDARADNSPRGEQ